MNQDNPTSSAGIESAILAIAQAIQNPSTAAWVDYPVSWTASTSNPSLGNGTLVGSYLQIGKLVIVRIELTFGSTTTIGNGAYRWSLPVMPKAGKRFVGSGYALRSGTAFEPWPVSNVDIFAVVQQYIQMINVGGGVSSGTRPWGNGDVFSLQFSYEAA